MSKKKENKIILTTLITKKLENKNNKEKILFFSFIGVKIFKANKRKYAEPAIHASINSILKEFIIIVVPSNMGLEKKLKIKKTE